MGHENITVVARIRPALHDNNEQPYLVCDLTNSKITAKDKSYTFNKLFNGDATQETVFDNVGLPIVQGFIGGMNATIFAYGQTGSGKTYTMLGPDDNIEDLGIIPRAIKRIFEWLDAEIQEKRGTFKFTLKCSFLQIYKKMPYDLLQKNASVKIKAYDKIVTVKDAAEVEVKTVEECMGQLRIGLAQRTTAETKMHQDSSRSHAIFMLTLETETCENDITKTCSSRLNLVDLAGSERQSDTGNTGIHLQEAGNINNSLSVLARVIRDIIAKKNKNIVPYRESNLTLLLRDSLGGNSKTTVLINLHPNSKYINQTISTLEFAVNIKKVKNTAKINEQLSCKEVESLKTENSGFRQENTKLMSKILMLEEESNIQKEHTKVIEAKLIEIQNESTKTLQQKDDEIKQLHIDNTAKMEELYIQMAKLQAENDEMKRLKTLDEKATQCDEIIKETNVEFARPFTPPLRSTFNTTASSGYGSNDTVRQSEANSQIYQSYLSNEEARVPSSNGYSMTHFPHQTFQSNPSTTILSNSVEAARASAAGYSLNSFMSQTSDNTTLTDRSYKGRFSTDIASSSVESDVLDVVKCLLNIISFNDCYRKNENDDVDESSVAPPGFNAAQKQSEVINNFDASFNVSYDNDYHEDEFNFGNASKEHALDFPQLADSPQASAHNNTITLDDTPCTPLPITIGDSPFTPRPHVICLDETPIMNRKHLPLSKKQSTFKGTVESANVAETSRRRGNRQRLEDENSILNSENPNDERHVPSASEESENSEDESTFDGELPSLPLNSPMIPNIHCRCKTGCKKQSCKCLKNGINCSNRCHRNTDCYNGYRIS